MFAFHTLPFIHRVYLLIDSSSTAALPYRKPASAGTSRDSCRAEGNDKRDALYFGIEYIIYNILNTTNVPQLVVSGMSRVNRRYYINVLIVHFRCICQRVAKNTGTVTTLP